MNTPAPIDAWGLLGAATLILFNGGVSVLLRLGLARRLLVASIRTIAQLILLGYVLVPIFHWDRASPVVALCTIMVFLAAAEAVRRVGRRYRGMLPGTFVSLFVSAGGTAVLGTHAIIGITPWWTPQYLIPILGMLLGNILNGVSLGLDRFLHDIDTKRQRVELDLALGANRWEAARPLLREALRVGMMPIINSMTVVGLVTIPGMMTGQILGGSAPDLAARYQIVIMFLIAAATTMGLLLTVFVAAARLFDEHHRLRFDRLKRSPTAQDHP